MGDNDNPNRSFSVWFRKPRDWSRWLYSGKYPSRGEALDEIDLRAADPDDTAERVALPAGVTPTGKE